MRKLVLAVAVALGLGGIAQAAPVSGALGSAAATLNPVEQAQYVYGGHKHCWYGSGWKGPGWYWCGYRWRNGYGYGGPVGWNGWTYGGAVVVAPGVAVGVAPYYWGGRHYYHRRWYHGGWRYY